MLGRLHLVLLPLALLLFIMGIARLFELRFSRGDVYPPYSSLRSDPLGAKALFKGLQRSGLHEPECFIEASAKLGDGDNSTLLLLGTQPGALDYLPVGERAILERYLHTGGQIVISLHPYLKSPYRDELREKYYSDDPDHPHKKRDEKTDRKKRQRILHESLSDAWGISFYWPTNGAGLNPEPGAVPPAVRAFRDSPLPATLPWHSLTRIQIEEPDDWEVLYRSDGAPVVARRRFGPGSVIVLTDSWVFSNEALRDGRKTALLSWFFNGRTRVLFDETHLGVQESEGVATLARKYRLHGLAMGLAVLTALFIWRSALSLVPPRDDLAVSGGAVTGRHSQDGFVNLVRRSVRPSALLATCFAEWRPLQTGPAHRTEAVAAALGEVANKRSPQDLVNRYRAAFRALKSPAAPRPKTVSNETPGSNSHV